MRPFLSTALVMFSLALTGCSYFGIETEADIAAAKKEANNKAVGAGCRYSNRNIEQCYELNPKASKAGIFLGWKDMDAYMREHKISGTTPTAQPTENSNDK